MPSPNNEFVAVAAGGFHTLGLKSDGSIVCWGSNDSNQCAIPPPSSGITAIAAGYVHSLALREDGSIAAWGRADEGQINVPLPNAGFVAVAAGYFHSLALKNVDCNGNGIPDSEDIANGTSQDCTGNGIPDECELDGNDCNANGVPDECELVGNDCNANGVPDECEPDCNGNGVPDECDLISGTSEDCNANAIPDECDIAACHPLGSDYPGCDDCNLNGVPDACDIALGRSLDVSPADGVPDECTAWDGGGGNANWSTNANWDNNIVPNNATETFSVTIAAATVDLDIPVTIDSLRLLDMATVNVTGAAGNDLMVVTDAGLLVQGSETNAPSVLNISNDRLVSVAGQLTIGPEGQVLSTGDTDPDTNSIEAGSIEIRKGTCECPQLSGGLLELAGTSIETSGDFVMVGSSVLVCTTGCPGPRGGVIPPPKLNTDLITRIKVRGDLELSGHVDVTGTLASARNVGSQPEVLLSGDFRNHVIEPCLVELGSWNLTLDGNLPQRVEVGGKDLGASPEGFGPLGTCPFYPGRTLTNTNFSLDTLEVLPGREVVFEDTFDNLGDGQTSPEALYIRTLILWPGSVVTINGAKVYVEVAPGEVRQIAATPATPTPAPAPHDERKNRYLSFDPNNFEAVAFELSLTDHACSVTGKKCATATDCQQCVGGTNNGNECNINSDCPGGGTCTASGETCAEESPPISLGWIGEPRDPSCQNIDTGAPTGGPCTGVNFVSRVVSAPVTRPWTEAVVHVGDCEVSPVQTYLLRGSGDDGTTFTQGLVLATVAKPQGKFWGDVVGSFDGVSWSPPNFLVNVDDVVSWVKFVTLKPAPHTTVLDLDGQAPNWVINATDLQFILQGFSGKGYPPTAFPTSTAPLGCL